LTAVQHATETLAYLTCRCTCRWVEKCKHKQVCSWSAAGRRPGLRPDALMEIGSYDVGYVTFATRPIMHAEYLSYL